MFSTVIIIFFVIGTIFFSLYQTSVTVGTVNKAAKNAQVETLLQSVKMAVFYASRTNDPDSDGVYEAITPVSPSTWFSNAGGLMAIPVSVYAGKDPWGSHFGYCVWDHGSVISANGLTNAGLSSPGLGAPAFAIFSAGPDKIPGYSCSSIDATTGAITKPVSTDDPSPVVVTYGEFIKGVGQNSAFKDPVATKAILDTITTDAVGTTRLVLADSKLYTYSGTSWAAVAGSSSGSSGTGLQAPGSGSGGGGTVVSSGAGIPVVSAANSATYLIASDGKLYATGYKKYAWSFNDGSTSTGGNRVSFAPDTEAGTDNKYVFAVKNGLVVVKTNGDVYGKGENESGSLGINGNSSTINTFTKLDITNVVDYKFCYTGSYYSFALKSDNTLWGKGTGFSNWTQLKTGVASFDVKSTSSGYCSIALVNTIGDLSISGWWDYTVSLNSAVTVTGNVYSFMIAAPSGGYAYPHSSATQASIVGVRTDGKPFICNGSFTDYRKIGLESANFISPPAAPYNSCTVNISSTITNAKAIYYTKSVSTYNGTYNETSKDRSYVNDNVPSYLVLTDGTVQAYCGTLCGYALYPTTAALATATEYTTVPISNVVNFFPPGFGNDNEVNRHPIFADSTGSLYMPINYYASQASYSNNIYGELGISSTNTYDRLSTEWKSGDMRYVTYYKIN